MKSTHKNTILAAAVLAAMAFIPTSAKAQTTVNVPVNVTVLNAITMTLVDPLSYGTIAAIADATETASYTLAPTTAAATLASTGAPATIAVIDNATVSDALLEITDGADGATINYEIDNVVNPLFGGRAFTLANFTTSYNGGAPTLQVVGTPFGHIFANAFGGGTNTLAIGARITTTAAAGLYADGNYVGSFDVIASY